MQVLFHSDEDAVVKKKVSLYINEMKNGRRIAIIDRSFLAHNVYQMLLKPLGYSLLRFNNLKNFKDNRIDKMGCCALLINSNVFGKQFDTHLNWMRKEAPFHSLEKIFFCNSEEKKIQEALKKLPHSHVVVKPFYPQQLKETLEKM